MVGCSVNGCFNRSEHGFIMKYFPKDKKRREEWTMNLNQGDWKPTDRTVICEVHFAPEMWEKTREDGKRKLKLYAVPTIFPKSKQIDAPIKRILVIVKGGAGEEENSEPMLSSGSEHCNSPQQSSSSSGPLTFSLSSENASECISPIQLDRQNIEFSTNYDITEIKLQLKKEQQFSERLLKRNDNLKNKLKVIQSQARSLKKKNAALRSKNKYLRFLHQIFNNDQIYAIKNVSRFRKWKNVTVKKPCS